ncbi:S26A5 protein, partial [Polypterus senegalus]
MIGGVVVREAPDAMFDITAGNDTDATVLQARTEARDAMRVKIAAGVTLLAGLIQSVVALGSNIKTTNVAALIVGVICIILLVAVKEINDRFKQKLPVPIPVEIIVVIISTGASYGLNLSDTYGVDIVGNIPTGLLPPALPDFGLMSSLLMDSVAIAIVGFSMSISMAKIFAIKHGYKVSGNQIAGLLSSLVVLLVIVAIGYLFEPLPQTGVDPAELQAAMETMKKGEKKMKEKQKKTPDQKRKSIVKLTKDMEMSVKHELVDEGIHEDIQSNGQCAKEENHCLETDETQIFLDSLTHIHYIILDFTPAIFIDSVGTKTLKSIIKEYNEVGITVLVGGCRESVLTDLNKFNFFEISVTRELFFPTIHDAVLYCRDKYCAFSP